MVRSVKHALAALQRYRGVKTYRVPIEQKSINETPHDALILAGRALLLEFLEFCSPSVAYNIFHTNHLLFVEVIVASMIRGDLARLLDMLEESDETVPGDGTSRRVPVLYIMHRMIRDKFLRLGSRLCEIVEW